MAFAVTILYSLSLLYVFLFSIGQLHLTWLYIRKKNKQAQSSGASSNVHPYVTIQLPIYNERYVVARLIDSIANLSYPKDKLEIQILDDSTDDTTITFYSDV